jgi:hypothetical protein
MISSRDFNGALIESWQFGWGLIQLELCSNAESYPKNGTAIFMNVYSQDWSTWNNNQASIASTTTNPTTKTTRISRSP